MSLSIGRFVVAFRNYHAPPKWYRHNAQFTKDQRKITFILNNMISKDSFSKELGQLFNKAKKNVQLFIEQGLNFVLRNPKMAQIFVRTIKNVFAALVPDICRMALKVNFWWCQLWLAIKRKADFGCFDLLTAKHCFVKDRENRIFVQSCFPTVVFDKKMLKKLNKKAKWTCEENNREMVHAYKQRLVALLMIVAEMNEQGLYNPDQIRQLAQHLNRFMKNTFPNLVFGRRSGLPATKPEFEAEFALYWLCGKWAEQPGEESEEDLWRMRMKMSAWNWKGRRGAEKPWKRNTKISQDRRRLTFLFNNFARGSANVEEIADLLVADQKTMKWLIARAVTHSFIHMEMAPIFVGMLEEVFDSLMRTRFSFRQIRQILEVLFKQMIFSARWETRNIKRSNTKVVQEGGKHQKFTTISFCGYLALWAEMAYYEFYHETIGTRMIIEGYSSHNYGHRYHDSIVISKTARVSFAVRWLKEAIEDLEHKTKPCMRWSYEKIVAILCISGFSLDQFKQKISSLKLEFVEFLMKRGVSFSKAQERSAFMDDVIRMYRPNICRQFISDVEELDFD
ncbi:hypothetical protein L596_008532 [Steinernema carpocapsae]|uniref:Uncharacterized protein n=1 Tax=Steinernema carpocapsae TaxID=34508 RepID=A0A4U5PD24_STECR|nr:hypothetical protein L596_008532 [Steinernema carpocapsae]